MHYQKLALGIHVEERRESITTLSESLSPRHAAETRPLVRIVRLFRLLLNVGLGRAVGVQRRGIPNHFVAWGQIRSFNKMLVCLFGFAHRVERQAEVVMSLCGCRRTGDHLGKMVSRLGELFGLIFLNEIGVEYHEL